LCQYATVQIPRPNSTTTDEFRLGAGQITALPSAPVSPLVGPIQSPTPNGSSLFQPATLNTATLNLSWAPPIGSQPFGYYISMYLLRTLPGGASGYIPAGKLGTAKTSATLPFLTAGNTYILVISAQVDAGANMESAPYRTKLPVAYSTVDSAPITHQPGCHTELTEDGLEDGARWDGPPPSTLVCVCVIANRTAEVRKSEKYEWKEVVGQLEPTSPRKFIRRWRRADAGGFPHWQRPRCRGWCSSPGTWPRRPDAASLLWCASPRDRKLRPYWLLA
jgi:hypothetical protein